MFGMGGFCIKTDIFHQIACRQYGNATMLPAGPGPLVVPCVNLACCNIGEQSHPEITCSPGFREDLFKLVCGSKNRPALHFHIITVPCPPPGSPAPDMGVSRKIVAFSWMPSPFLEVGATDGCYPGLITVALQQLVTEPEKDQLGTQSSSRTIPSGSCSKNQVMAELTAYLQPRFSLLNSVKT